MVRRTKRAVLVSLQPAQTGSMISLDDVVEAEADQEWTLAAHFTRKCVTGDLLDLSDDELAAFGYAILARLNAFRSADER